MRTLRMRRGLSQRQVADMLGFSAHGFVGFLESGKKQPSAELVVKIADLFGVSTDALMRDELDLPEE
jgi:transcriptional regulator with XRE-family HTH domain